MRTPVVLLAALLLATTLAGAEVIPTPTVTPTASLEPSRQYLQLENAKLVVELWRAQAAEADCRQENISLKKKLKACSGTKP